MKFDTPAGTNPIDQLKVIGKPHARIDGPLKTTGTAPYAYERHDVVANQAYGYIVGSAIAKGRINAMDLRDARAAPGVIHVVGTTDVPRIGGGSQDKVTLFGGADIQHYHQAVAIVVAETFEQARAAAALVRIDYARGPGSFDLASVAGQAPQQMQGDKPVHATVGDFDAGFKAAAVTLDQTYTTPDESHAMMEPHSTIAAWDGDKLTMWTSHQIIRGAKASAARMFGIAPENVRIDSPYIGGGFGAKLSTRADAVCAGVAAR
ncbi:MAG: molybdopterin cofactor-binding domain-containing protein, partial [Hyphomicrobiaceae bacterium]